MRYLKPINEDFEFDPIKRKIKDLVELNLSYLEDENYEIWFETTDSIIQQRDFIITIQLVPNKRTGTNPLSNFSWNDVKDRVIPLVKQLDKEFDVEVEIFDGNYDDKRHHTTDLVMHDGPSRWFAPKTIRFIKIKVKRYLFKKGAKL